jgi:hypothetical protein
MFDMRTPVLSLVYGYGSVTRTCIRGNEQQYVYVRVHHVRNISFLVQYQAQSTVPYCTTRS